MTRPIFGILFILTGGLPCDMTTNSVTASPAFIPSSKRRKGYPSETRVKRGARCVHGDKELLEKLGRLDPCPCGSGRRFQELLHALRMLLTGAGAGIMSANEDRAPLLAKGARNGAPEEIPSWLE